MWAYLHQTGFLQHCIAGNTQSTSEQNATCKAQNHIQHCGAKGCDHAYHHKQEHTAAERATDTQPCLLLGGHADQHKDGDKHRHQEDLREHAHRKIHRGQSVQVERQAGDGAAQHRAHKVQDQHQCAAQVNEGLSVSEFLLYFTAVTTFTTWVMGILQEMSALHKESLDISRIREFLEYPEPFKFEDGESIPAADKYELKLENVSFCYPGTEKDIIHNLNLTVHPGEKLAVVGLNGAGKTTLVKILCGLLDPTEGKVLLNGKDIREFNRRNYYDLFSAVFQEFSILDVTVAEEIAQTTVDIDYDRIADCIEKAGLTAMIEKLPKGLQTHVGREVHLDGVLFSGGQDRGCKYEGWTI